MAKTLLLVRVLLRENLATMLGIGNASGRRRSQVTSLVATGIAMLILLVVTGGAGYAIGIFAGFEDIAS